MPPIKGQSKVKDFLKKQGVSKAHAEARDKDTTVGNTGEVPAGVTGIAQLIKASIDEYGATTKNPGKPYLHLRSVVVSPKQHEGIPIDGLQISKRIDLFTTTGNNAKKFEDQWDKAMAQLRTLGLETKGTSEDDIIDSLLPALEASGIVHRFRTWKGDKQTTGPYANKEPLTNTDFGKPVSGEAAAEGATHEVQDNTSADENQDDSLTEDWSKIGNLADSGDIESQNKITAKGKELGVNTVEAADWAAAATAIAEAEQAGGSDSTPDINEGDAAEPWKPEVGHVYMFQIKGAKKPESHEVTAVFKEKLNLKRESDGRPEKGVTWSADPDMLGGKPLISQ